MNLNKEKSVLFIKIVMSTLLLFVPKVSDFLTLESKALGAYFVAFFIASCITIGFAILYIGFSIIKYIQNKD